ncbi:helix-turn-helix domain-containing protein [Salinibacterium sp. SYSU T00001]|uniref:helix-turn-helix domain-containing protein n=1 Tax=Homoserinimonas sedimenticola TaxID=2986805 RepID=UPI002235C353|nr:helix-turn-helix domain-containing protein [Salinibacterium sedimenticola]MCW4385692.1 helix-turn-helix domain-containing protein [Salinibacterium sedimenticola]
MGTKNRADAVLHPQRMRIIRTLATTPQTSKELAEALPDIPQASLYRHLTTLLDTGILRVSAERQVRGAVERTYALGEAIVTGEDVAAASPDDHFRYFSTFVAGLLGEFAQYVEGGDIAPERDGVGYREHVLQLSHEELLELLGEIRAAIARRADNTPSPERSPRLLATVTLPTAAAGGSTLPAAAGNLPQTGASE